MKHIEVYLDCFTFILILRNNSFRVISSRDVSKSTFVDIVDSLVSDLSQRVARNRRPFDFSAEYPH